jgi:hypothetical protein
MRTEPTGGRPPRSRVPREPALAESARALLERILALHGSGFDDEAIAGRILALEPEVILFRTQTLVAIVLDLVSAESGRKAETQSGVPWGRNTARPEAFGLPGIHPGAPAGTNQPRTAGEAGG